MTNQSSNHRPLKVEVMVTLERDRFAGGHVKCWERFGEAAADTHPSMRQGPFLQAPIPKLS